jgi:predicted ATPase with chaperone activity
MAQVIRTNIKFKKNDKGHLYGFVSKTQDGSWRGVREESTDKKKIVFIDDMAERNMQPNVLYHCLLVPMNEKNGFIVMNAKAVKFPAKITTFTNKEYRVEVQFGNKTIVYDPSSTLLIKNNMQNIANMLRKRYDLVCPMLTADEFLDAATIVNVLYKRDKSNSQN